MALTLSSPYKTNTLSSVSGSTFNSNGTPFASGDVGRYIIFTSGSASGQIRRVTGFTDTNTVTTDSAWDESPFLLPAQQEVLPSASDTWVMSYNLTDLVDGTNLILEASGTIRQPNGQTISFTPGAGAYIGARNVTFDLHSDQIETTAGNGWIFGDIDYAGSTRDGYSSNGVTIKDNHSGTGGNAWAGDGTLSFGSFHFYSGTYNAADSGLFVRWYNASPSDAAVIKIFRSRFYGGFGGRMEGSRSVLVNNFFAGSTVSYSPINPRASVGRVSGNTVENQAQAIYHWFNQGLTSVVSGLSVYDISTRIARIASSSVSGYTLRIRDTDIQALQDTGVPLVVCDNSSSNTVVTSNPLNQSLIDSSLSTITDTTYRSIDDVNDSNEENVSTTSGGFPEIELDIESWVSSGTINIGGGTAKADHNFVIGSFEYQLNSRTLPMSSPIEENILLLDDNDTTATEAATSALATQGDINEVYDKLKLWKVQNLVDNYPSRSVLVSTKSGGFIDFGASNVDIATANTFGVSTGSNTITLKPITSFDGDIDTLGTVTMDTIAEGRTIKNASSVTINTLPTALTIDNTQLVITTVGTYDFGSYSTINGGSVDVNIPSGTVTVYTQGNGITVNDLGGGGTVVVDTTSKVGSLTITGLSGQAVYIENDSSVQHSYSSSETGTLVVPTAITDNGTWRYVIKKYGEQVLEGTFDADSVTKVAYAAIPDSNVTDTAGNVAAYTTIDNVDELYDYIMYYKTTNTGIPEDELGSRVGGTLDIGAKNLTVDATHGVVFDNTIEIKSASFDVGVKMQNITTNGTFALQNGATKGNGVIVTDSTGTTGNIVIT